MKKTSIILLAIVFLTACKKETISIHSSPMLSLSQSIVISNPDTVNVQLTTLLSAQFVKDRITPNKYNVTYKAKGKTEKAIMYITASHDTLTYSYYSTIGKFYHSYKINATKNSIGQYVTGVDNINMLSTFYSATSRQTLAQCVAHAFSVCSQGFWCSLQCLSSQGGYIICGASWGAACLAGFPLND